MKKILLSLICLLTAASLHAQLVNTGNDTSFAFGTINSFEIVAKGNVRNTGSTAATFRWVRVSSNMSANWTNAICDVITCYSPFTDSSDFTLNPNEVGNVDAHFYPAGNNGNGVTRVRVYEVSNPNNQVFMTFVGSTGAASVNELKKPEFNIYPIPATDVLYLKGTKNLQNGKVEVFNIIGKKVLEMSLNNVQNQAAEIQLHSLPKGNYILRVSNGRQIVSKAFIKQ